MTKEELCEIKCCPGSDKIAMAQHYGMEGEISIEAIDAWIDEAICVLEEQEAECQMES